MHLKEEYLDTIIYFRNIKVIHLDLKVYGTDQRSAGVKGCLPQKLQNKSSEWNYFCVFL